MMKLIIERKKERKERKRKKKGVLNTE